ncbi:MAG: hypothetical protein PHH77_01595 [Victivallaceae bacterium]|nr:hypothetical protein [Victivallaceae bacterium]
MLNNELQQIIESIVSREPRYSREAYKFVNAAVNYAAAAKNPAGHIHARELLAGVSEFALKEYSIFYEDILKSWGINTAADIGNIVFALVDHRVLGADTHDSIEDFNTDYDLFALAHSPASRRQTPQIKVPTID